MPGDRAASYAFDGRCLVGLGQIGTALPIPDALMADFQFARQIAGAVLFDVRYEFVHGSIIADAKIFANITCQGKAGLL